MIKNFKQIDDMTIYTGFVTLLFNTEICVIGYLMVHTISTTSKNLFW